MIESLEHVENELGFGLIVLLVSDASYQLEADCSSPAGVTASVQHRRPDETGRVEHGVPSLKEGGKCLLSDLFGLSGFSEQEERSSGDRWVVLGVDGGEVGRTPGGFGLHLAMDLRRWKAAIARWFQHQSP